MNEMDEMSEPCSWRLRTDWITHVERCTLPEGHIGAHVPRPDVWEKGNRGPVL